MSFTGSHRAVSIEKGDFRLFRPKRSVVLTGFEPESDA